MITKGRTSVFILCVAALFFAASITVEAQTYDKGFYFNRAKNAMSQGRYLDAINDLNTVLKLDEKDVTAYNTRGVAYERCGDFSQAMADYQTALKLNPNAGEARHNIEVLNQKSGAPSGVSSGTPLAQSGAVRQTPGNSAPQGHTYTMAPQQGIPMSTSPSYQSVTSQRNIYSTIPEHQKAYSTVVVSTDSPATYNTQTRNTIIPHNDQRQIVQTGTIQRPPQQQVRYSEAPKYLGTEEYNTVRQSQSSFLNGITPENGYVPDIYSVPTGQTTQTYNIDGYRVSTFTAQNGFVAVDTGYGSAAKPATSNYNSVPSNTNNNLVPAGTQQRPAYNSSAYTAPPTRVNTSSQQQYKVANGTVPAIGKIWIDPTAEKYNDVGVTLSNYGQYKEAIDEFNKAISRYPEYAIAFNNRGVAFALSGNKDLALADFNQALRLNPYYFDAQFNRDHARNLK